MRCRRCKSDRLIRLQVINPSDNPVFRCGECGFLFSPARADAGNQTERRPATPGIAYRQSRPVSRGG